MTHEYSLSKQQCSHKSFGIDLSRRFTKFFNRIYVFIMTDNRIVFASSSAAWLNILNFRVFEVVTPGPNLTSINDTRVNFTRRQRALFSHYRYYREGCIPSRKTRLTLTGFELRNKIQSLSGFEPSDLFQLQLEN